MRCLFLLVASFSLSLCSVGADAFDGPARGRGIGVAPAPASQASGENDLGGGFIELLLTGRDPSPSIRPVRQLPVDPETGRLIRQGTRSSTATRPSPIAALPSPGEAGSVEIALDPKYERQIVSYDGPHAPGTIVIDTPAKFLFLVLPGGKAIRYGIGVGRPGFEWAGVKHVTRKAEWPDWRPPPEMLKRRPDPPVTWLAGRTIPLGQERCISVRRCTGFTARTSLTPLASRSLPVAFEC